MEALKFNSGWRKTDHHDSRWNDGAIWRRKDGFTVHRHTDVGKAERWIYAVKDPSGNILSTTTRRMSFKGVFFFVREAVSERRQFYDANDACKWIDVHFPLDNDP